MANSLRTALIAGLLAVLGGGPALAGADWGRLDDLQTGRAVPGPAGWLNWCMADPSRCGEAHRTETLPATGALVALLEEVQGEVNAAIAPRPERPGVDLWRADATAGDCEDYALAKRARLRAAGLPAGAVRLATAALPSGELHAVLTVETDRGTLVLDNLRPGVVPMRALDYAWRRLEGTYGRLEWRELGGTAMLAAGQAARTAGTASLAAGSAQ
ncbi:MAG: transglutaminase-like cysteine peptidase [Geminicoccaceae bacterium]